jgi:outer membrane protein W
MKKVWILALLVSVILTGLAQQKGEWRIRLRGTVVAPDASAVISHLPSHCSFAGAQRREGLLPGHLL